MSWTIFFCANILQKEFNLLQMEQVDLWLHPSLVCEHFLALRCSLTSPLVASLTSSQIYKHILALKEFVCSGRRLSSLNFSSTVYTVCQLVASLAEDGFCGNGNIRKNTDNIIGKKWTWSCWKDIEIIERGSLSYIWTNCARSVKAVAALWWWDFAQRKVKYNKPKSLSCRKTVLD